MLRELHITNLAVIEDVTIELGEGLNCFTGQTGAGKSLILGAFEILLGLRSGSDMLRPGAEEARVAGVFEIHDPWVAQQISAAADSPVGAGEQLLITRRLFATGRSSVSINGQPATAPMVRAIGELLVDVHGQHDHQYLLKPSNQLSILDAFGHCTELREQYSERYVRLRELQNRHRELTASRTLRKQQLDLYEFQAEEIDKADLAAGEYHALKDRHALLSNIQKIKRDAGQAYAALYDSEGAVVERLQIITHLLTELAEHDKDLAAVAEQIRTSTLTLQESAFELGRHVDRLDLNPAELAEIEDRLNTVNRLVAKYSGSAAGEDPAAEVLAYRDQIGRQITELRGQNEDLDQMEGQIKALRSELATSGADLTKARRAAAGKLRPLVEAQLRELGMGEAGFDVSFETVSLAQSEAGDGNPATGPSPGATGLDAIEMMVRTNPGQPARPLRKIASGGEMSRIMLALKSILAQNDRVSVLVFDEIDANVGGRMGTVIGSKLRQLANGGLSNGKPAKPGKSKMADRRGHQVLCITHLPQIAAFADRHVHIAKEIVAKGKQKETRTVVRRLEGETRIQELAEMLAGKDATDTTRKQAKEMLAAAE